MARRSKTIKVKNKQLYIPITVEGENVYLGKRKYTFTSLFIMTFIAEFVAIAAIFVSAFNVMTNGWHNAIYLVLSILLFAWGQLYEQALRKARKLSNRKTFIKSMIDRIWGVN